VPDALNADFEKALKLIEEHNRILLITHKNPDGDALGSLLALHAALLKQGKTVNALCDGEIPERFSFLNHFDRLESQFNTLDLLVRIDCQQTVVDRVSYNITDNVLNLVITPTENKFDFDQVSLSHGRPNYDLIITLDTPELHMLGSLYEEQKDFFLQTPLINIDHHVSNQNYGQINLVESKAPSTGEVLFHFFEQNKIAVDEAMATALLTAIITDTGSFQHASTTSGSFTSSARLMELGGDLQKVIEHVYRRKSVSMLKLWGKILSRIQHEANLKLVWVSVAPEDFQQTEAKEEEAVAALNDLIIGIPDVDVALMLYQYPDRPVRGSLRTSPRYNASDLAGLFGGGGHPPAAGFLIDNMPIAKAREAVLDKLRQYLNESISTNGEALTPEEIIKRIGQMMDSEPQGEQDGDDAAKDTNPIPQG